MILVAFTAPLTLIRYAIFSLLSANCSGGDVSTISAFCENTPYEHTTTRCIERQHTHHTFSFSATAWSRSTCIFAKGARSVSRHSRSARNFSSMSFWYACSCCPPPDAAAGLVVAMSEVISCTVSCSLWQAPPSNKIRIYGVSEL
jgi:hypothetical protein